MKAERAVGRERRRPTGRGSGTAVIVSHGDTFPDSCPFGVGVAGETVQMCSDYYDYFVRSGAGSWTLTLPVDDTFACNSEALANQLVYFITDVTECDTADNPACWDLITDNVSASGQSLLVGSLTPAATQPFLSALSRLRSMEQRLSTPPMWTGIVTWISWVQPCPVTR